MGRRNLKQFSVTGEQRAQLDKLAEAGASDAELLAELYSLLPKSRRAPAQFADVLHAEFRVPRKAARSWLIDDGLAAGLYLSDQRESTWAELADRCWRWIHRCYRSTHPARRISRLTKSQHAKVDARAVQLSELVTTPVQRSRDNFEQAIREAYRLADLAPPRVLWVDGPGTGLLLVMLCLYHGPERKFFAELLSERRFMRPPKHQLDAVIDSLCVALREFIPAAYEADLPRYLNMDLLGPDVSGRLVDGLLGRAVSRLDPVRSTRLSGGIVQHLKRTLIESAAQGETIRAGALEALRRAIRDVEEVKSYPDFIAREPGIWWQDLLGRAAVAHTSMEFGADPVFPLARLHKLAWALASDGFWSWTGSKVLICADGPTAINMNDDGALHADNEPALAFRDGLRVHAVNGFVVPEIVVSRPESITVEMIQAEVNAEVRRIMIDAYGRGRYLTQSGARVIDMDMIDVVAGDSEFGCMPRALMRDNQEQHWLVGTDGSTRRVYYMRVASNIRTCSEAHDALAGFDESKIIASS